LIIRFLYNRKARGFNFLKRVEQKFKKEVPEMMGQKVGQKIAPASWGLHGRGAEIAYTIVNSPFGRMLVAVTERGICALSIHQPDETQERELHRDFRNASIRRDDAAAGPAAQAALRYLRGEAPRCEVALDVRATPFQLRVWEELCAIPRGATRSYGEIAARIGRPSAARAVGHAVGANPVSILIPCHRACGSDGSLTGYRWGLEVKEKLLAFEHTNEDRSTA
jgi:AraC family transcriptional regulator, regulatory protein of adaptative response / methylated-DNA-[protein]-cysteine methyltransferase